jgi:hypothetical protein
MLENAKAKIARIGFLPAIGNAFSRYDLFPCSQNNLSLVTFITRVPIPGSAHARRSSADITNKEKRNLVPVVCR